LIESAVHQRVNGYAGSVCVVTELAQRVYLPVASRSGGG